MKLEKVTAEIRPRGRWESIDLGCALVRENYGKVFSAWMMTVVPLWFLIIALCQLIPSEEAQPWIAGFLCVWLLPFFDRIPLFVISRRLFDEDSRLSEMLKALPGMFTRRIFLTALIGPFDLGRGLSQPVMELEGLKGKAYRERVSLLSRNGGEGASQASLISFVLVLATMFSMFFVFISMLGLFGDALVLEEFWVDHVLESDAVFIQAPYVWIVVGIMLSAVSLVEPFYVGAGFAIYINSRTVTEGWDIELAFKRMSERVRSVLNTTGKAIALTLVCLLSFQSDVIAGNARLEKVMAHEDFEVHSEIIEIPIDAYPEDEASPSRITSGNGAWLSPLSSFLFWVAVAALIAAIIWLIYSNRFVFRGVRVPSLPQRQDAVQSVMGMDIAPESLPDDIVRAAREAWDKGSHQLALSMMYRGSISALIHQDSIEILEADTELDCLREVQQKISGEREDYFTKLTHCWMRLAYGSEIPADAEAIWFFGNWPFTRKALGA